jgi:hypothetical protein
MATMRRWTRNGTSGGFASARNGGRMIYVPVETTSQYEAELVSPLSQAADAA